jgi:aminopeptidase N
MLGLKDPFYAIRQEALEQFLSGSPTPEVFQQARIMAQSDPNRLVRAAAIDLLAKTGESTDKALFTKAATDSSYTVAGAALDALASIDSAGSHQLAKKLMLEPCKGRLVSSISNVLAAYGDPMAFDFVAGKYAEMPLTQAKFELTATMKEVLEIEKDPIKFKKGIDLICEMRNSIPAAQRAQTDPFINSYYLRKIADTKKASGETELAEYVLKQIPTK